MLKLSDSDYRKFVILANPRTGSTLLKGLLSSHVNVICRAELLNRPVFEKHYNFAEFGNRLCDHLDVEIWNQNHPRRPTLARGFKVMYHNFKRRTEQHIVNYLLNERVFIIHLTRNNLLNILLSAKLTSQLGTWGGVQYPDSLKVTITPSALRSHIERQLKLKEKFDRIFQHHKIKVIYEDLCQHEEETMRHVLDFLQLPQQPLFARVVKQRVLRQKDHILNYNELKEAFSDTPYAWFFED